MGKTKFLITSKNRSFKWFLWIFGKWLVQQHFYYKHNWELWNHLTSNYGPHITCYEAKKINWFSVSERFNQYLRSNAFELFKENCPLYFHDIYRQSGQNQANTRSCFETKISFKKHVFWSKKFIVSDTNSLEQFVDGQFTYLLT